MSVSKRLGKGKQSVMKERNDNIIRTLTYVDSDGELSPHEHDGDISVNGSSPLSSPYANNSDRMEDQSSGFFEMDLPPSSPCPSPRPRRRPLKSKRHSPIPFAAYQDEGHEGDIDEASEQRVPAPGTEFSSPACPVSPPHRRLRALRLFDTPHTPKSLLQKARRRRPTEVKEERVEANFNPFTPNNNRPGSVTYCGKRNRSQFEKSLLEDSADEIEIDIPSTKKIALHEINTSRYNEEFYEVCKLGDGEYGSVFKCVHRLDGCTYAIKKSKTPVAGSVYERNAMNEVYAHAVLGIHQHVVRYYSAWAEDDYMYIQNEYCNGGSLSEVLESNRRTGTHMSESDFKQVLLHVAQGLRLIHSQNLVHLDIKPGNIFIHRNEKFLRSPESGMESCDEFEDEEVEESPAIIYKIGDLGHVTSVSNPTVEDGDCRYLPKEILNDDFDHLTKADVFSLGVTMYETGTGCHLPKNGEEWHAIRRGELKDIPQYSAEINDLLKSMVHPDPSCRPSAMAITHHPALCPQAKRSRAQLRKELNEERLKNEELSRKLLEATKCIPRPFRAFKVDSVPSAVPRNNRLLGKNMKKSMSLSAF
ncbi:wee1-like protein kinase 1-A [Saccostrea echinata]|uniref:wee1-like protein kinase 1-A n=1 Tax=Saccostrea echinata TaxID=191078 RepID=UPI002A7F7AB2|nr:wee1-like protein kinase 1-A [Saccostrea echinata]